MGLTASHLISSRLTMLLTLISLTLLGSSFLYQVPKSISSCWVELDKCANKSAFMSDAQYRQLKVDKAIEDILSSVKDRESLSEIVLRAYWSFRLSALDFFPCWTYRGNRIFPVAVVKPDRTVGIHKVLSPFERKTYFYRRLCMMAEGRIMRLGKTDLKIAVSDLRMRTYDLILCDGNEVCFGDLWLASVRRIQK